MTSRRGLEWMLLVVACGGAKVDSTSDSGETTSGSGSTSAAEPTTTVATQSGTTGSTSSTTGSSSSTGEPLPPPVPDPHFCPLDWSGPTSIHGTAPFGQFTGTHAWFEWQFGNGFHPVIVVVDDPSVVQDTVNNDVPLARAVAFIVPGAGWEQTAWEGEGTPWVHAGLAGEWSGSNSVEGTVTITVSTTVAACESPGDVPRIAGEFSIKAMNGEWDLSGSFDAAYCGPLNDIISINCD